MRKKKDLSLALFPDHVPCIYDLDVVCDHADCVPLPCDDELVRCSLVDYLELDYETSKLI